ncbi:MOSC domain-containing protein [Quatrionicoccus australiensis]|uniref:MOSC domain-containing protein n=1 Tax=Quatrionicoccus australiensis TaxID=138118 RepID=UPI001CF8A01F|nr:MOSC domain-containing protein [Quatrionicoccus australiensis]UCV15167.1 MOSC domain-containing protein [Quatrionicoccus australiensis]
MAHISLFVGDIRPLPESGRPSGIYKQPATGSLELGPEGFIGDHQADRRVHGGPEKAVHLYPSRHYAQLAARFPEAAAQLVPGSLGENIATADLDESDVSIGDIYRLGSARLQVCQPRNPCWKIDERFASDGMALFIAELRLTGWYWRVLTPGRVEPGAELILEQTASNSLTLAAALLLCQAHRPPLAELATLAAAPGIAQGWQQKLETRLTWLRQNQAPSPATSST